MRVLGISAFYHDSTAALVEDGRIVAAVQEERFTRKKHDPSFPKNAISYCLIKETSAGLDELDHVVFYDKPFLKFERPFGNLYRARAAGLPLVPHGDAYLVEGEVIPEEPAEANHSANCFNSLAHSPTPSIVRTGAAP
jgi:predicted NodU family carbamoyl transferase